MKAIVSFGSPGSTGRLHLPPAITTVLAGAGALVALWAPAYVEILRHLGGGRAALPDALGWLLFAVGAAGLGSVVRLAWQDTRDPAWRARHGLPQPRRSGAAER